MDNTYQEIEAGRSLVILPKGTALMQDPFYRSDMELSEEELELKEELERLEKLQNEIAQVMSQFSSDLNDDASIRRLTAMCRQAEEDSAAYQAVLDELNGKVIELRRSLRQIAGGSDDVDGVDEEAFEDTSDRPAQEPNEDEVIGTTRNERRVVKSLFAKIASKTHPDRTSDPELIALFIEAKRMAEAQNLEGLKDVWAAVQGGSMKRSRIRAALQRMKDRIEELTSAIAEVSASPSAALLRLATEFGLERAQVIYRQDLRANLHVEQKAHLSFVARITAAQKELIEMQERVERSKNGEMESDDIEYAEDEWFDGRTIDMDRFWEEEEDEAGDGDEDDDED